MNGVLLAAGGAAVASSMPMKAFAQCSGPSIDCDPNALRGGNLPNAFKIPHWMRDGRLTWSTNTVTLAPSPRDNDQGTFPILEDNGVYDVIIAGSGLSGLSAAFYLLRQRPNSKVLILDTNFLFGGNAGRDDANPIPIISSTGGAYAVYPYDDFLFEIYDETGIDYDGTIIPGPFYSLFFDSHTPYALPGANGWSIDVYGSGLSSMPYPADILHDLQQAKQDFRNWFNRNGAPTDPADNTHPKYDYLAQMSLHDYLMSQGFHPAVSDFYARYAVDALSGPPEYVNALSSISFIAAEYFPLFTLPGGTSGIARHILKWLIPTAIDGSTSAEIIANPIRNNQLDRPQNAVRLRQGATVLRGNDVPGGATVEYYHDGNFYRASAKAVILAGQGHTSNHILAHIMPQAQRDAHRELTLAPVLTANVTINSARSLVDQGLGYNQYFWGSQYWADFLVADWVTPNRNIADRETVLTFYGGNLLPPEDMHDERVKLVTTPFGTYEDSLREDLNRVLGGGGFDFDRDVSAVYLYRWGHGMVYPKIGGPFGPPIGEGPSTIRTPAPRHLARQQLGPFSFAGQDTESTPAVESAFGSGLRCVLEVLPLL